MNYSIWCNNFSSTHPNNFIKNNPTPPGPPKSSASAFSSGNPPNLDKNQPSKPRPRASYSEKYKVAFASALWLDIEKPLAKQRVLWLGDSVSQPFGPLAVHAVVGDWFDLFSPVSQGFRRVADLLSNPARCEDARAALGVGLAMW